MRSEAFVSRFCVRRGKSLLSATRAMQLANPEGGGHGCPPFFDRARMASRKIPERVTRRMCFVGEAVFFGSVSLTRIFDARPFGAGFAVRTACVGPAEEMNPLAARRVEALDFAFLAGGVDTGEDQMLSSAGAAEFISFGRPPRTQCERRSRPRRGEHRRCESKKRNQRKTSPRSQRHDESFVPGFFDSPSMARSKNAAHPCAAPYGSACCIDHSLQSQSQSQSEYAPYRRFPGHAGACTR